jgi:hypothetical protein
MNEDQGSASMVRVFGQLLMLPIAAFVYGVEMLIKTMQEIQQVSNQGMEVMVGPQARLNGLPETRAAPAAPVEQENSISVNTAVDSSSGPSEISFKEETPLSTNGDRANGRDKDLHDDMLKLVRYKILFVRREYEYAFPEQEDLVSDNMDGSAFTAWKIAEFIQDLHRETTRVPLKWVDKNYAKEYWSNPGNGGYLTGLPHEDKKYLRVYYEVLERYPREKFKYEEQQIRVLEDIRDEVARMAPPPPSPPSASSAGAGGSAAAPGGTPPEGAGAGTSKKKG